MSRAYRQRRRHSAGSAACLPDRSKVVYRARNSQLTGTACPTVLQGRSIRQESSQEGQVKRQAMHKSPAPPTHPRSGTSRVMQ